MYSDIIQNNSQFSSCYLASPLQVCRKSKQVEKSSFKQQKLEKQRMQFWNQGIRSSNHMYKATLKSFRKKTLTFCSERKKKSWEANLQLQRRKLPHHWMPMLSRDKKIKRIVSLSKYTWLHITLKEYCYQLRIIESVIELEIGDKQFFFNFPELKPRCDICGNFQLNDSKVRSDQNEEKMIIKKSNRMLCLDNACTWKLKVSSTNQFDVNRTPWDKKFGQLHDCFRKMSSSKAFGWERKEN